ncbi:MAG: GNAT family N-acetyltransferase [Bacteroidales bacterium]|nr:GNAT family N-acetyltransferase [Bacteroidales bacterium]
MLENSNVRLRAPEPDDLELLYTWENDPDVWRVSSTRGPISRLALKNHIKHASLDIYQTKQLRLMIELQADPPQTVGVADLFHFDPFHQRAEVGLLIGSPQHRGKGLASSTLDLLQNYCFGFLGLRQLYCNIASSNERCVQLFLGHGFELVGEKRMWLRTSSGWDGELLLQRINPHPNGERRDYISS